MFGKIAAIQLIVILLMSIAGYLYFKHTESVITSLHEDKAKLETAVREQEATIQAQQDAADRQNKETLHLQQRLADADNNRRRLESLLRRKDLESMARANSADLETRVNRATIRAFGDIEMITTPRDRPQPPASASTPTPQQTPATVTGAVPSNVQPPPRPPAPTKRSAP
jgi:uncharacterized Zn finger protein (UPF0148 family)